MLVAGSDTTWDQARLGRCLPCSLSRLACGRCTRAAAASFCAAAAAPPPRLPPIGLLSSLLCASAALLSTPQEADIFSPPYLSKGPRPQITAAPGSLAAGASLTLAYTSQAPVTKALLLRAGAVTHSVAFDARALWLDVTANTGASITLATPASGNVLPPGL